MTTAHRATWKAARGGLQEEGSFTLHAPSVQTSAKDAPSERTLKRRQPGQGAPGELMGRDEMRETLRMAEEVAMRKRRRGRVPVPLLREAAFQMVLPGEVPDVFEGVGKDGAFALDEDAILEDDRDDDGDTGRGVGDRAENGAAENGAEDEDGEDESESDSDDEEAELLAELEKIRAERELENAKVEAEAREVAEAEENASVAAGNPLLGNVGDDGYSDLASVATGSAPVFAVKRRWDDDVVFREQAKGERAPKQRFINDTIRNDFHRRFLKRFIR